MTECIICCTNKLNKFSPSCSSCNFKTCLKCFQEYIQVTLEENKHPTCLNDNCKFHFTFTLIKTYTNFLSQYSIFLFKHISNNPDPQILLEISNKQTLTILEKQIEKTQKSMFKNIPPLLSNTIKILNPKLLSDTVKELKESLPEKLKPKKTLTYKIECPLKTCPGVINMDILTCTVCETKICKNCKEIKQQNHKCNTEILESLQTINAEARICPTCFIPIQKSEGCNDMHCIKCQKSFSYTTGEKIDHATHNSNSHLNIKFSTHTIPKPPKNPNKPLTNFYKSLTKYLTNLQTYKPKTPHLHKSYLKTETPKIIFINKLLKTHEKDYLNTHYKKLISNTIESLYTHLLSNDNNTENPQFLHDYNNQANNLNKIYNPKLQLPIFKE